MAKDSIVTIDAEFRPVRQSYFDNLAKKMTTEDLLKRKAEYQNKMNSNESAKGQMRIFNYLNRRFPKLTGDETQREVRSRMEKTGTLFGQTIIKAFLGEVKAFDKELKNRGVNIEPARFKIPAIRGVGGGFSGPIIDLEIGPQILKIDEVFSSPGSQIDKPLYED